MVKIRIRCKLCNEYSEFNVKDNDYFKWIMNKNVDSLNLSIDDKILFLTKKCNKCRLERRTDASRS